MELAVCTTENEPCATLCRHFGHVRYDDRISAEGCIPTSTGSQWFTGHDGNGCIRSGLSFVLGIEVDVIRYEANHMSRKIYEVKH